MITILGSTGFLGENFINHINQKIDFENLDIRKNQLPSLKSEVIINFIGKAHDHKGEFVEKDYYDVNYELVIKIYDLFINSNAKCLIHFSSIAAIEEIGREDVIDEESAKNPQSHYGKSKLKAELFLMSKIKEVELKNKKLFILRPTMIYGENDKGNLKLLFKIVAKNIPYPLGDFHNKRSFLYVKNLNSILERLVEKKDEIESGVYNVCDDQTISTNQIIKLIGISLNKKVIILSVPKFLIVWLAKFGNLFGLPLNTKRLDKMTSTLVVSNEKIKSKLGITNLLYQTENSLLETFKTFK